MGTYQVYLSTEQSTGISIFDTITISLIGTNGKSAKFLISKCGEAFVTGSKVKYELNCETDLGDILLVRLEKHPCLLFSSGWFCKEIVVEAPSGRQQHFPYHRWMVKQDTYDLRMGSAKKISEDSNPVLVEHRKHELMYLQSQLKWSHATPGIPGHIQSENPMDLPSELKFSFTKSMAFFFNSKSALAELNLTRVSKRSAAWKNLEDIGQIFSHSKTSVSDYVQTHWNEDDFFGGQYLFGCNPTIIKKCNALPPNFGVRHEMVEPFLEEGTSLHDEIKKGNIFLVDYKLLDGIKANVINRDQQYLPAPICLLYKNTNNQMLPIAIQLMQRPGPENPVFLPSDPEHDWMLAKMYTRSADFSYHQLVSHLLHTHLLAEVFCMATYRQLPSVHPLFKLLMPHLRYTLQINILARKRLLGKGGVFDQAISTGSGGAFILLQKAFTSLTYTALCLPDDIMDRDMETVPNYYYRDDGLRLWGIINRFVDKMVNFYYPRNFDIVHDVELQEWIKEIFTEGFLSRSETGIPKRFDASQQLIKFLTMVIFTCSVQHAAVNNGQFDFFSWMPNAPPTMCRPPPTAKGQITKKDVLNSLANIKSTCKAISVLWLLTRKSMDYVTLGQYPDNFFIEETPQTFFSEFQKELKELSSEIMTRNEGMELPYTYLLPDLIENSVTI
ncbi:polyunsaturated fatty acid lipoxygenase ALOX8-like isoform X2 [Polypterus senegalus]|uniref:polyunsaturated fatty acid lipoxygenase ALOX8-like isoform X2 n=1 Tax=Polypterus senegalus TaxID=55291 RepID=UPI001965F480|nr:polyunsaturated fatty acid lipoxygenase ALOX8-like isoform X2 [Polypterus senegalus]